MMIKGGFLDRLTDFLGDSEGQSKEEVRQELIDKGIDIDKITENVKEIIRKSGGDKWVSDSDQN